MKTLGTLFYVPGVNSDIGTKLYSSVNAASEDEYFFRYDLSIPAKLELESIIFATKEREPEDTSAW